MVSKEDPWAQDDFDHESGIKRSWADELRYGDWAFDSWLITPMKVRPEIAYSSAAGLPRAIMRIHWGLVLGGGEVDLEDLAQRLNVINEYVVQAVEDERQRAETCWTNREVWMSHIDERLVADDDLAEIAIQSLEFCEVADPEPLVKALALWLIGEWRHHAATGGTHCDWAVQNLLVTATDLGWYRGAAAERKWAANASSMRGKHAADALHEEDRRKKQEALAMYRSRTWPSKAEAARTIAYHFGITEQTALRWVREFSRALT